MATTLPPPVLHQITAVLENVPIFAGLSHDDLEEIAKLVRARSIKAGELLFSEGDPADKCYILQSGSVEVLPGTLVKKAGETVGEMALLSEAPRAITVRALEPTNLLVISRDQFEQLMGGETLAVRVLHAFAKSLATIEVQPPMPAPSELAVVSPLAEYSRVVQQSLLLKATPEVAGFDSAASIAQDDDGNGQALWDAAPFLGGGVIFAVMNAKGSALPPAHLLAVTRAVLQQLCASETDFHRVLPQLNDAVYTNMPTATDACVEVGLLHLEGINATFSIAGENPAMVVKSGAETQGIAQHGPALGKLAHFEYGATRAHLSPGDCAVLFSQSDRGLLLAGADLVGGSADQSARDTAAQLQKALLRARDYRRGDDISFVIARKT
jgi:hypothetical protein